MTYRDLVINIEIVINSFPTTKANYEKNLIRAQESIDTMMNRSILECNKPDIRVYGDTSEKNIKLKCVPNNLLTMYMSLTNGYELSDTVHYDNFTHLAQTNEDFIRDVTKKYHNMMRKVNLKSNTIETLTIEYYTKSFDLAHYDDDMFDEILEILVYEFELRCGTIRKTTFEEFKDTLYYMIKRVDMLYGLSYEKFDANRAWRILFSLFRTNGMLHHYKMCSHVQFTSMEFIYFPENLQQRMPKRVDDTPPPPPPPIQQPISERDKMLKFMKLPKLFNEKQLKKRFRKLAVEFHPDKQGDPVKFIYLKECYDTLKKTL